jgi:diacylglycerol kinase family enzyme
VAAFGISQSHVRGPAFAWEGAFLVLAVGNAPQAGGGHQLCPEALLDDGLLDVRVLPQLPKAEIPEALRISLRDGMEGVRRTLVGACVPWLEIETRVRQRTAGYSR